MFVSPPADGTTSPSSTTPETGSCTRTVRTPQDREPRGIRLEGAYGLEMTMDNAFLEDVHVTTRPVRRTSAHHSADTGR